MTDKTYNGWANHATWLVNVWTDGDDEIVRISSDIGVSLYARAQSLKGYVQETYLEDIDAKSGLVADLLMSAFQDVNWKELVEHYEDCEVEENDDES